MDEKTIAEASASSEKLIILSSERVQVTTTISGITDDTHLKWLTLWIHMNET